MVFLHFPNTYTDEEINLQAKYQKLKKKKKQLLEFTKPKVEPEKSNTLKRSLDPKEATELAKKLVISGKISVSLGKGQEQKTIFKRPGGLERKLTEGKVPTAIATKLPNYSTSTPTTSFSNPGVSSVPSTSTSASSSSNTNAGAGGSGPTSSDIGYTPFTSSTFNSNKRFKQTAIVTPIRKVDQPGSEPTTTTSPGNEVVDDAQPGPSSAIASTSSAAFGSPTPRGFGRGGGRGGLGYNRYEANNGPKPGHTVHVKATGGHRKFTEEFCREIFSKIGGNIVNITMELERNCGFVTFDKIELAEKAILELDKSYQRDNIMLSVSFARRQPPLSDLCNDPAPSVFWTHLATNQSQKSSHHDKRSQIVYPEEEFI